MDAARAIAILGMVMVHFGPNPAPDTALGNLYEVSHGRASVLFALLAGVGVTLLAAGGPDERATRRTGRACGRLVLRALLLLPLGLWLQSLDHGVLVILQYYAVYFLLAVLVLALPDRWLLAGAGASLVVGPMVYLWGEAVAPQWFTGYYPATIGDPPSKLARDLLLAGAYPLATWAAPLLVGLWVGRRDLASSRVHWSLFGIGLAVAVAAALVAAPGEASREPGLAQLLTDEPHSQMPLWMSGAIGSACATLGGMLLLVDRLPRSTWPLVATGQLALTVYVGHLLLLHASAELLRRETVTDAFFAVGVFVLLAAMVCTIWRVAFPRGPLEAALAAPWWAIEWPVRRLAASRDKGGRTTSSQAHFGAPEDG